jgi:hypothetical protein
MNSRLKMADITAATLDEYQSFLIKKGYKNSTVENHVSYFKQILKWAYDRGYLKHGQEVMNHTTPALKLAPRKAVIYLKWDEFQKLYNYKFPDNMKHLELTRDRFCFCCLTSLRHSDLDILRRANFDNPTDPTRISFVSKKTNDGLTIFLVPEAIELYKKYISIPTGGLAFPKKSNQKMNKGLKEIAKMFDFTREVEVMQYCGKTPVYRTAPLCEVIGTHAARRTFSALSAQARLYLPLPPLFSASWYDIFGPFRSSPSLFTVATSLFCFMVRHFRPFPLKPVFIYRCHLSFLLHGTTFSALSVIPPQKKWWGYDTLGLFCHTMKAEQ